MPQNDGFIDMFGTPLTVKPMKLVYTTAHVHIHICHTVHGINF